MGKKMKPKAKNPRKPQTRSKSSSDSNPNPNPNSPPDSQPQQQDSETQQTEKTCGHYTKPDSDLNRILLSILSSSPSSFSSCDHCRDESHSSNSKKGKKNTKKGGSKTESKLKSDPIWVCLDCGRSFCGGAVSEAVPYGHSRRHAKQDRHNWAVGTSSAGGTAWCFICDCEVPIEMPDLEEIAPASSAKSNSEPDYKTSESKPEPNFQIGNHHIIRGLSNLGNTCFFNSVMQNLLALKTLRESLFPPQPNPNSDSTNPNSPSRVSVTGPLTSSLRKLFIETSLSDEYKGTLSPKNLFSNICAKAPQFRGFQQQDSHELLRYLLDGLHTEEISARKSKQEDSSSDPVPVKPVPTLVDSVFGGLLSSTVSCMDCGFTSLVHEPFLDLSLPVPAKKNNNNNNNNMNKKGVVNRPTVVRGRGGRAQRLKQRPRSSPVEEEKDKLEASSPKEEEKGVGLKAEAEGPEESLKIVSEADEVAFSWMDFIEPAPEEESQIGIEGLVSDLKEKVGDSDMDGIVFKAREEQNGLTREEKDSKVLKATGEQNNLLCIKSEEEQDCPVLDANTDKIADGRKESDSTLLKADSDDVSGTSEVPDQSDSTVLKATTIEPENEITVIEMSTEYYENTVLNANVPESTVFDASPEDSENTVVDANTKESENTVLDGNVKEPENESTVLDANAKESGNESTVLDANTKEPGNEISVFAEDESWLMEEDNNESDLKPGFKPDPLTEDDSATMATDMGLSPSIFFGPAPNPNPNPVTPEEDETDFTGFGDMFNEPEEEVSSRAVNKPSEEDENDDSIFWGISSLTGFGFSNQEVDNDTDNPVSVSSCLSLFTKPEMLTGEHAWHCEKCSEEEREGKREKVRRDAIKRFLVDRLPRVLTVHLKRFGQDFRGRLSKLRGHVEFDEVLDVKPYFDPRSKEKERFKYRLVGVVEHSGSMSGGHYVAYVRGERKSKDGAHCQTWFYASDAHVKEVSLQQVLKSEAYLLFYERIED